MNNVRRRNNNTRNENVFNSAQNSLPDPPSIANIGQRQPRLPLSGSEDTYAELTFGVRRGRVNNNCYGYAIDQYRNSGDYKLQPGNVSKSPGELDLGSCSSLRFRALADMKDKAYMTEADRPCKPGYYKIMAFLSKKTDYHWYKQHKDALVRMSQKMRNLAELARALDVNPKQLMAPTNAPRPGDLVLVKNAGIWSHKQGFSTGPMLRDACGKVITDPRKACRNYGRLNYTEYCGSFCVKNKDAANNNSSNGRRNHN